MSIVLERLTAASRSMSEAFRAAWVAGDRSGARRISAIHASIAGEIEQHIGPPTAPNHRGFELGGES